MSRQSVSSQGSRPGGRISGALQRTVTTGSIAANPWNYEEGSDLDPYSPNFNVRKWTRSVVTETRGEDHIPRYAGIAFKNLSVHGFGSDADYQKTVGNIPFYLFGQLRDLIGNRKRKVQILNSIDGVLDSGEMLVVLGPPGSGCTTMLKTIAGEMNGIYLDEQSDLNYRGIDPKRMYKQFRGEAIYTAEVDVHFPKLVVGDTLDFAARARAPRNPPGGLSAAEYATKMRDVVMAIFGISHTVNTMVGNDFIRGVSGGERKRVSIAEATLASAPLQCWDNSTRGLDSANAIEFVKNLRLGAEFFGTTACVAIYQAPQAAYDLFDKVSVLYEGEQIFFGRCDKAKQFFVDMGFYCPEQQTTPDFLTSLTSPSERRARSGFEGKVPVTPREFAQRWKASPEYAALQAEIQAYNAKYPIGGETYNQFLASRRAQQSKHVRPHSPYTLSYGGQIKLCVRRGFQRLKADPSLTLSQLFGNLIMVLIISSIFYNLQPNTASFYNRGGLLFFAILMNAFGSALEILTLYAQRPIVEKHAQYAFTHPSAEAFASMLCDLPYKICNAIIFNITLYFMTNLRREVGPFFYFFLVSFLLTLTMSMMFRSIASLSRSLTQALAPAAVLILGLVIYTGFALPISYMPGWSRWMNYLDPIAYGFESLMINEFHGRTFECSQWVPMGPGYPAPGTSESVVCSSVGAQPGQPGVNGDDYLWIAYRYTHAHKWRNVGIIIAFMVGLCCVYLAATELITAKRSKGEILIYPRSKIPKELKYSEKPVDEEAVAMERQKAEMRAQAHSHADAIIQRQTAIFSWKDVVYDIKIKGEPRRILDHVDGWVKPGTLTALMGVSGAGKTTLLDVLATRVTMGVVSGEMLVDGRPRDVSFQRKTGYVQQQDLHLETSTVREALRFSAVLRQPKTVSREEKYDYVEQVLKLLEMDAYADAVVGVPGEGLNVEQRKRLTIGVELVAKPELLLFLDEPTSGLDSQTSWNILMLLRKLTANGQAILCTIHQPSAMLFEQFDRLLFLAKGGKTVYYGEVGEKSHILIDYFERNGAPKCPPGENPAEWMLSAIGAAPGSHTDYDWHQLWLDSPERVAVREELEEIKRERRALVPKQNRSDKSNKAAYAEFAAPFSLQFLEVLRRVFQQYWRTPSYIWSKIALCVATGLFIGFSFFRADTSQQGLQNQLFAVFMSFTIFGQLVQQIMPNFVIQRSLYEVRERPSKTYSWVIFILSNIVVEIPWSIFVGTLFFFEWYYPIGLFKNAIPTDSVTERGALMWLLFMTFLLFTSTFATAMVAGIELAETAGNLANLLFSLCLIFCGVLVPLQSLPGFWKFMNRVSPFTYLAEGMLATGLARTNVVCSSAELLRLNAPSGQTCGEYLGPWIQQAGGYVKDPASSACEYCAMDKTDTFLSVFNIYYDNRWRDFGLMWVYIIFNVFAAIAFYYLARVPKNKKDAVEETNDDLNRTITGATGISRQITEGEKIQSPLTTNGTDYLGAKQLNTNPYDEKANGNGVYHDEKANGPYGAAPLVQSGSDRSGPITTTDGSTRVPSPEPPTPGEYYDASAALGAPAMTTSPGPPIGARSTERIA
ncbi:putative xenobiotic-transporting ATPase [Cutaneotrichosporon oleaginosum]|uniref:Putative xenobiotic-transporting ATPase n=1 Tax=Cutaneotrichosporon oleaginosum TaxID=879819 RepID=A0A0J0XEA9_9TREE|nr:putative xenobiotic-transporting ATPase [Cutaneotrichosporon oleaginosum]KLT39406.1 putative xenobiotic-transporting ATPase [Cutaneotrichosporon oleaginosum]TXT07556.1 hypothetical protein COLE_04480 [Cutaneotrichosporon oleaginosum]